MKTTIVLATAALAFAAPAFAQQPASPPAEKVDAFVSIDADKSGSLTLAEVKIHDVAVTQADFDKYDADKSKSLSKAEFDKWTTEKKAAKPDAG